MSGFALTLLQSLPRKFDTFVGIMKHGIDSIELGNAIDGLNAKELRRNGANKETYGAGHSIRGRNDKRTFHGKFDKSKI